jgi:hypothetical protein
VIRSSSLSAKQFCGQRSNSERLSSSILQLACFLVHQECVLYACLLSPMPPSFDVKDHTLRLIPYHKCYLLSILRLHTLPLVPDHRIPHSTLNICQKGYLRLTTRVHILRTPPSDFKKLPSPNVKSAPPTPRSSFGKRLKGKPCSHFCSVLNDRHSERECLRLDEFASCLTLYALSGGPLKRRCPGPKSAIQNGAVLNDVPCRN